MIIHLCPLHPRAMWRRLALVGALVFGCLVVGVAQEDDFYPNTRERGRAAVEYENDAIHIVAAYYYSQRNHDSPWLLIEAAISADRAMRIQRDEIRLVMPDGREVPLASQRRFVRERWRVHQLLQNASVSRHGIGAYFKEKESTAMRFFALPFEGTARTSVDVDQWRVGWGDLFFVSPTGLWDPGTYSLVVRHQDLQAALPIRLE